MSKYSYKSNPFRSSRKRKKNSTNNLASPAKKRLSSISKGSWFDDVGENTPSMKSSASRKKIFEWGENDYSDESSFSDTDDDFDDNEDITESISWIVNIKLLSEYVKEQVVCRQCFSKVEVEEKSNFRAGLATKLSFNCSNESCVTHIDNDGFYTTEKSEKVFDINRKSVLASRIIGKGRRGLEKFCSVLGLSQPVSRPAFSEHTKYIEEKAFDLMQKNMREAAKRAKAIINNDTETQTVTDLPTSFDGSWSSRGWLAKMGIVSAIAENTSQVVDIVFKSSSCRQCEVMDGKKKSTRSRGRRGRGAAQIINNL